MKKKKNKAAQALGRMRAKKIGHDRCVEIASLAARARWSKAAEKEKKNLPCP